MGFFSRFFKKNEKIELKPIDLADWLDKESENVLSHIYERISKKREDFEKLAAELKVQLEKLDSAKFEYKTSPREKHLMMGNKETYLSRLNNFAANIRLPKSNGELQDFFSKFDKTLESLNMDTSRSYFILKNFHEREMLEIASVLKRMSNLSIEMLQLTQEEQLKEYNALKVKVHDLNESMIEHDKYAAQLSEAEKEFGATRKKVLELEDKIKQLESGESYLGFRKHKSMTKELQTRMDALKLQFSEKLLSKAVRKFQHDTGDSLVEDYINDPLAALKKDNQFLVLKRLQKLIAMLEKDAIKVKQAAKLIKELESIDKTYLENTLRSYEDLLRRKSDAEEFLSKSTAVMDHKELEYQLEHLKQKSEEQHSRISDLRSKQSLLQLEQKMKKLEKALGDFTGDEVQLIP